MNTKANLLKTLIREEIKRQLSGRRITENQVEKLTAAVQADKFTLKDFRQTLNIVAGQLMDAGLYDNATVSLKGNSIEVAVPGADDAMIDNLEADDLSGISVFENMFFDVVPTTGKKPGVSLRDFEKIVKQATQAAVGRFR